MKSPGFFSISLDSRIIRRITHRRNVSDKYNDFLKNRLYTRGLTNKYEIDKDLYSVYTSISIKL